MKRFLKKAVKATCILLSALFAEIALLLLIVLMIAELNQTGYTHVGILCLACAVFAWILDEIGVGMLNS